MPFFFPVFFHWESNYVRMIHRAENYAVITAFLGIVKFENFQWSSCETTVTIILINIAMMLKSVSLHQVQEFMCIIILWHMGAKLGWIICTWCLLESLRQTNWLNNAIVTRFVCKSRILNNPLRWNHNEQPTHQYEGFV